MRYLLIALLCFSTHALSQEVSISPNDTTQSVVTAQKGKRVTIRLRSVFPACGTRFSEQMAASADTSRLSLLILGTCRRDERRHDPLPGSRCAEPLALDTAQNRSRVEQIPLVSAAR